MIESLAIGQDASGREDIASESNNDFQTSARISCRFAKAELPFLRLASANATSTFIRSITIL
jgi:hypothetical protein